MPRKFRYYQQVGYICGDKIHDALILKRLPQKQILTPKRYVILDIEQSKTFEVSEKELMFGFIEDIERINYLISGVEDRESCFEAVIETDYPHYIEIKDILWNNFLNEYQPST